MSIVCKRSSDPMHIGVGALIQVCFGSVMAALTKKVLLEFGDSLQGQALVIQEALHFAFDIGLRSLEVDVENKELLCLIQFTSPCLASICNLVEDICYF